MTRIYRVAAMVLLLASLAGCIIAPAEPPPPAYGYAPGYAAPGYYAPGYAVYPPPVSLGLGFSFGGGGHHWR